MTNAGADCRSHPFESPLKEVAERAQAGVDVERLADHCADQQRAQQDQRILRCQRVTQASEDGEEAKRAKERVVHALRQPVADQRADGPADEDGQRVQQRA